jgi:hypothetical protein
LYVSSADKSRFTVVLSISGDGDLLKALVIFRGLKKVPKCAIPDNVAVVVNMSGTMDSFYSFKAHQTDEVLENFDEIQVESLTIPGGFTSVLQPLDVSINKRLNLICEMHGMNGSKVQTLISLNM